MKKLSRPLKFLFYLSLVLNIGLGIYAFSRQNGHKAAGDKIPAYNYSTEYMARINEFWAEPNDTNEIIFLGDSHTANFLVSEFLHDTRIRNRGINGNTITDVINRLDEVTEGKPAKIFLEIGVNDITSGEPIDSIKKKYALLVEKIRISTPSAILYVQSVFPTSFPVHGKKETALAGVKSLNQYLQELADEKQIKYINLFDSFSDGNGLKKEYDSGDHLHLNGAGYLKWRDLVKAYVEE